MEHIRTQGGGRGVADREPRQHRSPGGRWGSGGSRRPHHHARLQPGRRADQPRLRGDERRTRRGNIVQRPGRNGEGWDSGKEGFVYTADATITSPPTKRRSPTPGSRRRALADGKVIDKRGLKDGAGYGVDLALASPPYEDLAGRDRHLEAHAIQQGAAGKDGYSRTDPARHVSGYGKRSGQVEQHEAGGRQLPEGHDRHLRACLDATKDGGVMALVTDNYIRDKEMVDLAQVTIDLARIAGWTPVERWRALKRTADSKVAVSFWRVLGAREGASR